MGRHVAYPLDIGGQYSAGDAASIPSGTVLRLSRLLPRPGKLPSAPPYVYDSLMSVNGLANFDDRPNRVNRLAAANTSNGLFVKGTSGEVWGSAVTGASTSRISSFANLKGLLFWTTVDANGVPNGFYSYNGATVDANPSRNGLLGRDVTLFDDRLYLLAPRATITNRLMPIPGTADYAYDASLWVATNVTKELISANGTVTGRITPTALTGAFVSILGTGFIAPASSSVHDRTFTWLCQLQGTHATYDVPITLELISAYFWHSSEAVKVGYERVPTTPNGFRYRCTTAGTTDAATEPVWPVAPGTVNDNGVVWTFAGPDVIASFDVIVPNVTTERDYSSFSLRAELPAAETTIAYGIGARIRFGTLTTLAGVNVSLRDGLADGDLRKANRGQQITDGDFDFPFFNVESTQSATVDLYDDIVWCETGRPDLWPGSNTYRLTESSGAAQAACAGGGRYVAYKRGAFWVFQGTTDADVPIRREGTVHEGIGAIGPLAHDIHEDTDYIIGESDIYAYQLGGDNPEPICGNGMREEIMARGSDWVESQGTYNMPILAIDKKQLIVWVYVQKAKLYAYDLRLKVWSTHPTPNGAEVAAMLWNQNTGHFYVAFGGHGLARMDYATGATTGANDTIDNTGTSYPLTMSVTFKPIEPAGPQQVEFTLDEIVCREAITIAGQQVTGFYSFDQGRTFPVSQTMVIDDLSAGNYEPLRIDCCQTDTSITPKIECVGKGGEAAFSLSPRIYAMLNVRRGEVVPKNQTAGASTL